MPTEAKNKNSLRIIAAEVLCRVTVRAGVRERFTNETVFSQNCSPYRIGRRHVAHLEA